MSLGLGGPHAVSKALGRCQRFNIHRRKPDFGDVNPLDLPLILLALVFSAFPPELQAQTNV
jgi:hypothetical protein